MAKSLEEVLEEYFNPKPKKAKGEAKFIIVVNGCVLTERIKNKKELDKVLKSIALEDARMGTETTVLVYKLEGKAEVNFQSDVAVGEAKTTEEEAE